jgi:hypothetical protein
MFWLIRKLVILALLLALVLPVAVLVAGLEAEPLVPLKAKTTPEDVARAKALVKQYDPRGRPAGELRTLELPERDVEFVLDYVVGQLGPAAAAVDLRDGAATVSLSVRAPENPRGRFFNLGVDVVQLPGGLEIEGLRLGAVTLPPPVARGVGWLARVAIARSDALQAMIAGVNGYRVTPDRLVVVYQWQPELVERVKTTGAALLVDTADRERLMAYAAAIAGATRDAASAAGKTPLTEVLGPVFDHARARTGSTGNAAAENRAAIIATMLYLQGVDVPRLLGEPGDARHRGMARMLTLRGRRDFAQHFVLSAGIAAAGGSQLADSIGLFKELDDSRGGSGFSFSDLAADRAGVRFAEVATGPAAARVQGLMAERPTESLFMPDTRGLPEFMPEADFARRFGGVDTPRYRAVAEDVERRISALEIHGGTM